MTSLKAGKNCLLHKQAIYRFLLAYFIVLQYKRRRDLLSLYVFYLGIKKEGKWCFRLIFISVMASSDKCDVKHSGSSADQYDPLKVDL